MRTILILLSFVGMTTHAATKIECTDRNQTLKTIAIDQLQDCDDLSANTVCDYVEGNDAYSGYGFDRDLLAKTAQGASLRGFYFEGYVHQTWVLTLKEDVDCVLK